jgi:SNF2 family DNA or RNA helicase
MKQKDAEVTAKLAKMTEPFILRRKKADVLKDLPDKLEETRSSEMSEDQRQLYDAQLVRMKTLLESAGDSGEDKMRILAEITRLRQICCDPRLLFENYDGSSAKRAACIDLIQSAIDGGHRMLVFSQFTSMLDLLAQDLKEAGIAFFTLTGSTPKQERIRLVNTFNEGDVPVFLISLKAGGTGLNLTGADVVVHYDPWWNLAVQNQATDRAHRIGQTREVTVIKLIAAETIEEKIVELQETKRELADAIISGENTSLMSLSRDELMALLE